MSKPRNPRRLRSTAAKSVFNLCVVTVSAIVILIIAFVGRTRALPNLSRNEQSTEMTSETPLGGNDDLALLPAPTRNVAKGEKLSTVPFTSIKWPKSRLSSEYLVELSELEQSFAGTALPMYLPIPRAALSRGGIEGNQVTERIPQGMRAITVRVDAESAVEGWAQSGNSVDVILVRTGKEISGGLESKVIAENVRILSAGRSVEPLGSDSTAPNPPSTVTLLVNQEDTLKIKTGASIGKLTFALRGFSDQLPTVSTQIDQRALLGPTKSLPVNASVYGTAKGPDGQKYILSAGNSWTKTEGSSGGREP